MDEIRWPFVGVEALAAGLIPERTMRTKYEQMYPGVFMPREAKPTARQRADGAWLWSKRRGVLAGQSAAVLHGTKWIEGKYPSELLHDNREAPELLVVRSEAVNDDEITRIAGMRVTTPARTGFDIGRHTTNRLHAVQRYDALACATGLKVSDVEAVAAAHPGARGLPRLRRLLPLVDGGAESPLETLARLILIDAGLPVPQTQVRVFNEYGGFVARVDMADEDLKIALEYDGPQHWEDPAIRQLDIDKGYELLALGWIVIRVSRDLLKYRRNIYVRRVEEAGAPVCDVYDGIEPETS